MRPHPASVIRQGATLFDGFAPRGQTALFGPRPDPATRASTRLMSSILPEGLPVSTRPLGESPPSFVVPAPTCRRLWRKSAAVPRAKVGVSRHAVILTATEAHES
jgi:hypothetical protein